MGQQMRFQPVAQARALWRAIETRIVDQSRAVISSPQGNDPTPPAVAREMVRRGGPADLARTRIARKAAQQIIAVPILHIAKARPDRAGRMLGKTAQEPQPAGQQGRPAARINDPAGKQFALSIGALDHKTGGTGFGDVDRGDLRRSPDVRPGFLGEKKDVLIEDLTIHLVGWQAHLIKCSELTAALKIIFGSLREPEAQAVLRHMVVAEVIRQCQAFGKEAPAHLRGRLTDLAIKVRRSLEHHNTEAGSFAPEQQRGCRTGKRTAYHGDIVAFLHSLLNRRRNERWQTVSFARTN